MIKFNNALNLLDERKGGETSLGNTKNDQTRFKSNLSEIKKEKNNRLKEKSKRTQYTLFKRFTKQGKMLLNFLMIILQ